MVSKHTFLHWFLLYYCRTSRLDCKWQLRRFHKYLISFPFSSIEARPARVQSKNQRNAWTTKSLSENRPSRKSNTSQSMIYANEWPKSLCGSNCIAGSSFASVPCDHLHTVDPNRVISFFFARVFAVETSIVRSGACKIVAVTTDFCREMHIFPIANGTARLHYILFYRVMGTAVGMTAATRLYFQSLGAWVLLLSAKLCLRSVASIHFHLVPY